MRVCGLWVLGIQKKSKTVSKIAKLFSARKLAATTSPYVQLAQILLNSYFFDYLIPTSLIVLYLKIFQVYISEAIFYVYAENLHLFSSF